MNGLAKVKCISGDCGEMIYYLFFLHHGGYCTKHPEKWPIIQKGWVLPQNIHKHVEEIYKKRTKLRLGLNNNEK